MNVRICLTTVILSYFLITFGQTNSRITKLELQNILLSKIQHSNSLSLDSATILNNLKIILKANSDDDFRLKKIHIDKQFHTSTYRLKQVHKGVIIDNSNVILHFDENKSLKLITGVWYESLDLPTTLIVNYEEALHIALSFIDTTKLVSQYPNVLTALKKQISDVYPKPELSFWKHKDAPHLQLVWITNIYLVAGESFRIIIDANTGLILEKIPLDNTCNSGNVSSAWYNSRTIWTTYSGGRYYLTDDCTGQHPYTLTTYNLNQSSDISSSTAYSSSNSSWSTNAEITGATPHWCMDQFEQFLDAEFQRDSWDGSNGDWISYANALIGSGSNNASFSSLGYAMFGYGSTSSPNDDWSTLDIVGHEFTHGIDNSEGDLSYQYESGALDESFADIFGEIIEDYVLGYNDWLHHDEIGAGRSLSDPNAKGDPDTYLGDYWFTGSGDNGGVHTNSGVQNFMFYLLCEGGSGTNDNGDSYSVNGIGISRAREIAYIAHVDYMTSNSDFIDSRQAWLDAANDAFPGNNNIYQSVEDAWCAVGVGTCGIGGSADLEYSDHKTLDGIGGAGVGDGDGRIEPGESIDIPLEVYNAGNGIAHNVEVIISCSDPDVTISDNDITNFNDIGSNSAEWGEDFDIEISGTSPDKDVTLYIDITSDEGSWSDNFNIHIYGIAPQVTLDYIGHEILDGIGGEGVGNGDGLIHPGESIDIPLEIYNSGNVMAHNVQITLSCFDTDITITDSDITNTNDIAPNSSERGTDFDIDISPSATDKDVTLYLDITSDEGSWSDNFDVHIYGSGIPVTSIDDPTIFTYCELYPNPNNGIFSIDVKSDKTGEIEIACFDLRGAKIYKKQMQLNNGELKTDIDLSTLSKGVYIVRISGNGKYIFKRVTITW